MPSFEPPTIGLIKKLLWEEWCFDSFEMSKVGFILNFAQPDSKRRQFLGISKEQNINPILSKNVYGNLNAIL